MATKLSKERVFALKGWSVRTEGGKYYVQPTAYHGDQHKWLGPHKNLITATTANAKKLQAEFTERNARLP